MEDIDCLFYYDTTSKSCLKWKVDRRAGAKYNVVRVLAGSDVGSLDKASGYYQTCLNGKSIRVHRVIWTIFNGEIPSGFQIDHIDGNRGNNSICNLRCVEQKYNTRNKVKLSSNTSGTTGVSMLTTHNGMQYWRARWSRLDGKETIKCFSIKAHGNDEAFRLACEHRERMIVELNENGAMYTAEHGKRECNPTRLLMTQDTVWLEELADLNMEKV